MIEPANNFSDWVNCQNEQLPETITVHRHFPALPDQRVIREGDDGTIVEWWSYPSEEGSFTEWKADVNRPLWEYCPTDNRGVIKRKDGLRYWGRTKYKRLKGYHEGTHNLGWEDKWLTHRQQNWYRCHAIASQLELTDAQKARVLTLLFDLDLRREGRSIDHVVYTLCCLVSREDGRRTYPPTNGGDWDPVFAEVAEREGFTESKIRSWIQKYSRKLNGKLKPSEERRKPATPPRNAEWWSLAARSEETAAAS